MSSSRNRSSAPAVVEPVTTDVPEIDAAVIEPAVSDEPTAGETEPSTSETPETVADPLTPASAPKYNVKRDVTERMITLVSENLELLLAGATTPEQTAAARAFVSNYFSYAPGVQQSKIAWPSNFDAITPLKSAKK